MCLLGLKEKGTHGCTTPAASQALWFLVTISQCLIFHKPRHFQFQGIVMSETETQPNLDLGSARFVTRRSIPVFTVARDTRISPKRARRELPEVCEAPRTTTHECEYLFGCVR
jgi:hypothetical protein